MSDRAVDAPAVVERVGVSELERRCRWRSGGLRSELDSPKCSEGGVHAEVFRGPGGECGAWGVIAETRRAYRLLLRAG